MDTADSTKRTVRVTIFNQSYTVSTSGRPEETEVLAAEVDELMSAIARKAGNLDSTRTAVLACLHLADKLRTVESRLSRLKDNIDHRSRDLEEMIDRVIVGSPDLIK